MKYLMIGALLFGCSLGTMAQEGTMADVDAVKNLVSSKPADYDKQLKNFLKVNKKKADVLVAIGRVLFEAKDTAQALAFANQAQVAAKNNCAPAYILMGDIASMGDNGGLAASNYEQAIWADPKNPEAYRKYAIVYSKLNPEMATQKLEDLRNELPGYPVDALIARTNYNVQRYATAIEAYGKVPLDQLERIDFIQYARALQLARKFEESQRIVEAGLQREPLNGTLNRFALMNCNDLKKYPEAIKFADVLFTKVDKDSVTLKDIDYQSYGKAFYGNGQFDEAIAKFKEAFNLSTEDKSLHADLYKSISDAYKGLKDYPNAIESYKSYLIEKADADATDWAGLGSLYTGFARTQDGAAKKEALGAADVFYGELITKFPDAEEFGLWQRGRLNAQIESDVTEGKAKPFFIKLTELVNAHEEIDDTDKDRLFDAYSYIMRYNLKQKDHKAAYEAALKLQEIHPNDADIQRVVESLAKLVK